jgi:hypothetical protein
MFRVALLPQFNVLALFTASQLGKTLLRERSSPFQKLVSPARNKDFASVRQ